MLWSHPLFLLTSATHGIKFMSLTLLSVFYLSHLFFFLSLFLFFCLLLDWGFCLCVCVCESTCWLISCNSEQWSRNSLTIVICSIRWDHFLLFLIYQALVPLNASCSLARKPLFHIFCLFLLLFQVEG